MNLSKKNTQPTPAPKQGLLSKIGNGIVNGAKAVGGFLTSSEQAFGNTLGTAASVVDPVTNNLRNQTISQGQTQTENYLKLASQETDPTKKKQLLSAAMKSAPTDKVDIFNNPDYQKTAGEILGEGAGTALDIASIGSYGEAAKGAEAGKLLVKSGGLAETLASKVGLDTTSKIATPVVVDATQKTLGQTLKTIGTNTLKRAGVGAGTGYGYDVSQNLQEGKTGAAELVNRNETKNNI
jgi:hypothetical protein